MEFEHPHFHSNNENKNNITTITTTTQITTNNTRFLVAVKILKMSKKQNLEIEAEKEVSLMRGLTHPNIVSLIDYKHGAIIMKYCNGGSLDRYLRKALEPVSKCNRFKIAVDISEGMKYLHSLSIFHKDLRACNILVRRRNKTK
jgi:serine/threonine protein kinase